MNKNGGKQVINRRNNNKHLVNQETRFNESIRSVIPNAKFICIKFYDDSLVKKNIDNNENFGKCDVVEIVTHISINTKKFRNSIIKAGYRLFDVMYEPDGFHFFVRKVGERET